MSVILKKNHTSLFIDLPKENYLNSRFDWSGKVTQATYDGISLLGHELANEISPDHGRGLYNEFGFKQPLGFDETKLGDWFHKIGIGLLRKDSRVYDFSRSLQVRPATFEVDKEEDQIIIHCTSSSHSGYAYELKKKFMLQESGWSINYQLVNTGEKMIVTNEYTHNFLAVDSLPISSEYLLSFGFEIKPDQFEENINPENLVKFDFSDVRFIGKPNQPFFFSYLSGNDEVDARWTLINERVGLAISQTCDFQTKKVFLWGSGHVISPELFINIELPPGEALSWKRVYQVSAI